VHQLRSRLTDERGFTLIELLMASMIGMIVLFAAFTLIDVSSTGQHTVENRIDASTRGRNAMEQVTRQLRAQVCLGKGIAPIVEAGESKVVFYASVAPAAATPSAPQTVQRRTLEYVPDGATGRGKLVETVVDGDTTPPPNTLFNATPRVRTITDNVAPVPGVPLFRYWKYDPNLSPQVQMLSQPIGQDNRAVIVQIQTAFDSFPVHARDAERVRIRLDNKVTVRTADPTDPTRSPKCI
jgi:prepilin-type N-terminal cleavage/methylation domain-containing protein